MLLYKNIVYTGEIATYAKHLGLVLLDAITQATRENFKTPDVAEHVW